MPEWPPLRPPISNRRAAQPTAIHKLLFAKPLRYSEDIDLVQTQAEPIGATIEAVRKALSWLGKCKSQAAKHSTHLIFSFIPETGDGSPLKLQVEINTREHKALHGLKRYPFAIASGWHRANVEIVSFKPEEIFGTKLRALLQRNKNRDLFDLNRGLLDLTLDRSKVIACFDHYLALEGNPISRANAERRMLEKLNKSLTEDIAPLLPAGVRFCDRGFWQSVGRINRADFRRSVEVFQGGDRRDPEDENSGPIARHRGVNGLEPQI
jgi:predicted nucleotidyltransferase component of viral defense system